MTSAGIIADTANVIQNWAAYADAANASDAEASRIRSFHPRIEL